MKVNHLHLMVPQARVDALHRLMADDGLGVSAPRREHAYSFYVNAPGGFLVEVGA
jgi:hypothetical protein